MVADQRPPTRYHQLHHHRQHKHRPRHDDEDDDEMMSGMMERERLTVVRTRERRRVKDDGERCSLQSSSDESCYYDHSHIPTKELLSSSCQKQQIRDVVHADHEHRDHNHHRHQQDAILDARSERNEARASPSPGRSDMYSRIPSMDKDADSSSIARSDLSGICESKVFLSPLTTSALGKIPSSRDGISREEAEDFGRRRVEDKPISTRSVSSSLQGEVGSTSKDRTSATMMTPTETSQNISTMTLFSGQMPFVDKDKASTREGITIAKNRGRTKPNNRHYETPKTSLPPPLYTSSASSIAAAERRGKLLGASASAKSFASSMYCEDGSVASTTMTSNTASVVGANMPLDVSQLSPWSKENEDVNGKALENKPSSSIRDSEDHRSEAKAQCTKRPEEEHKSEEAPQAAAVTEAASESEKASVSPDRYAVADVGPETNQEEGAPQSITATSNEDAATNQEEDAPTQLSTSKEDVATSIAFWSSVASSTASLLSTAGEQDNVIKNLASTILSLATLEPTESNLRSVAAKASVAVLSSGGDQKNASAVAVSILSSRKKSTAQDDEENIDTRENSKTENEEDAILSSPKESKTQDEEDVDTRENSKTEDEEDVDVEETDDTKICQERALVVAPEKPTVGADAQVEEVDSTQATPNTFKLGILGALAPILLPVYAILHMQPNSEREEEGASQTMHTQPHESHSPEKDMPHKDAESCITVVPDGCFPIECRDENTNMAQPAESNYFVSDNSSDAPRLSFASSASSMSFGGNYIGETNEQVPKRITSGGDGIKKDDAMMNRIQDIEETKSNPKETEDISASIGREATTAPANVSVETNDTEAPPDAPPTRFDVPPRSRRAYGIRRNRKGPKDQSSKHVKKKRFKSIFKRAKEEPEEDDNLPVFNKYETIEEQESMQVHFTEMVNKKIEDMFALKVEEKMPKTQMISVEAPVQVEEKSPQTRMVSFEAPAETNGRTGDEYPAQVLPPPSHSKDINGGTCFTKACFGFSSTWGSSATADTQSLTSSYSVESDLTEQTYMHSYRDLAYWCQKVEKARDCACQYDDTAPQNPSSSNEKKNTETYRKSELDKALSRQDEIMVSSLPEVMPASARGSFDSSLPSIDESIASSPQDLALFVPSPPIGCSRHRIISGYNALDVEVEGEGSSVEVSEADVDLSFIQLPPEDSYSIASAETEKMGNASWSRLDSALSTNKSIDIDAGKSERKEQRRRPRSRVFRGLLKTSIGKYV